MSVPGIVQSTLDDEEIAARVSLGGDDELYITPTRTIIYRAEGLLSDESVDEFPHDAERITLSEGRRKTRFSLEYPLDDVRDFAIPSSRTEEALHPVLAGVLNGNGITDPGETVVQTYRFSELTLIITSDRLVKHIGEAVWDGDFEQYHFDDVTNLSFEDGSVATQIVLEVDGRQQRIKAPNDRADEVRNRLEYALFEYYDVDSLAEFNAYVGEDEDEDDEEQRDDPTTAFGDGVDPLDANPPEPDDEHEAQSGTAAVESDPLAADLGDETSDEATAPVGDGQTAATVETTTRTEDSSTGGADRATAVEASGFDSPEPRPDPEVLERLDELEATVERQNELLKRHQETIEQLITELRQGR